MKTLYLFATSPRPDSYVNAIAYSVSHLEVDSVLIVVVSEHGYLEEEPEADVMATEILTNITLQLRALKSGEYLSFDPKRPESRREALLNPAASMIYSKCLDVLNRSGEYRGIVIPYQNLGARLKAFSKSGDCLFDVSALKKNLAVDIVAFFLSLGFSDVYSFELHKKPTFGQGDLYHCLQPSEYVFRNLSKSKMIEDSLRRMTRWSIRFKTVLFIVFALGVGFFLAHWISPHSIILDYFNLMAVVASIASFLYLFVQERSSG